MLHSQNRALQRSEYLSISVKRKRGRKKEERSERERERESNKRLNDKPDYPVDDIGLRDLLRTSHGPSLCVCL